MDNLGPMKKLPVTMRTRRLSRKVSYVMGSAGTGQPYINYPQLNFNPRAFFALGSPIGMFVTIRGIDTLGENFALPTCPSFFNIFHPFDPVAYRVESLINPEAAKYRPKLIPHHKGRKRMHLGILLRIFESLNTILKDVLVEINCTKIVKNYSVHFVEVVRNNERNNEVLKLKPCPF